MNTRFCVYGLKTGIIYAGDDLLEHLRMAWERSGCGTIRQGDILVLAESAVAMAEGRQVWLAEVTPGKEAGELASHFGMDPRLVEVVLDESDQVVGGIPGFLLCLKKGTLLPNAGVDQSNAPPGCIIPLPRDPDGSAERLREQVRKAWGVEVAVIIADSRTHAMRLGCAGVAIGCAGMASVVDERGRKDLFGRELYVTQRAVADCIASAAELVMGEADESTPAALIRGLDLPMTPEKGVASIDASECLFMGVALHADPAMLRHERKTE